MTLLSGPEIGESAQASQIESVKIYSYFQKDWAVAGTVPFEKNYTIELRIGGYYRDGEPFPEEKIRQLENALKKPQVQGWDPLLLGEDADWFKNTREEAVALYQQKVCKPNTECLSQKQIEWYSTAVEDPDFVSHVQARFKADLKHFTSNTTKLNIQVILDNGDTIELKGRYLGFWLLPWEIKTAKKKYRTFHPALSHAVSALLPKKDRNQYRFSMTLLEYYVITTMRRGLQSFFETVATNEKMSEELAPLLQKYRTKKSHLRNWSVLDSNRRDGVWLSSLVRIQGPENLYLNTELKTHENHILERDKIFSLIDTLFERAVGVPWLIDYLEQHPKASASLEFNELWFEQMPFDAKGFTQDSQIIPINLYDFVRNMEKSEKIKLVQKIRPLLRDSFKLTIHDQNQIGSNWVLLPNGYMILNNLSGTELLDFISSFSGSNPSPQSGNWIAPNGMMFASDASWEELKGGAQALEK